MSIHRKAFLCILLTGLFSAAFVVFSYSRLFDLIEFEYYAPSISRDMQTKINADARAISAKFGKLEGMFERMLENTSIRSAFAPNQNQIVIFDRSRIAGELTTAIPELQWIRIVDAAGRRIHFSTDGADYVMRSGTAAAYRAWTETPNNFQISADMLEKNGIMLDDINERVIFYMQFYDNENIKRGVALFSLSSRIIYDALLSAELVRLSDPISLVSEPDGILIGLRADYDGSLREAVGGIWKNGEFGISGTSSYAALRNIVRSSTRRSFVLFSKRTEQNIFVGFLVSEDNFTLPDALKIILVTMFTITIFVVLFFLFNIKQDTATIIQNRVRNLQVSLYREYSEHKLLMDWGEWKRELASRREDVRMELRRGFGAKKLKYADAYINSFFDRCWDELVNVISSQTKNQLESLDEKKLEDILKRILAASTAISDSLKGNTPNGNTLKGNNPDTVKKSEKTVEFQPDSEGEIMQELDESGIKNEKAKPDELEEFLESEALESELSEAEEIYALEASPKKKALKINHSGDEELSDSISAAIVREIKAKAEMEIDEKVQRERSEREKQEGQRREEEKQKALAQANIKRTEEVQTAINNTAKLLENDPFETDAESSDLSPDTEIEACELPYGEYQSTESAELEELEELKDEELEDLDLDFGEVDISLDPEPEPELEPEPVAATPPPSAVPAARAMPPKAAAQPLPEDDVPDTESDPFSGIAGASDEDIYRLNEGIYDDSYIDEIPEANGGMPLDDIEELEPLSDEEIANMSYTAPPTGPAFTFEDPHKGTDINKISMQIEFSKPKNENEEDFEDMEMDITSPESMMFGEDVSDATNNVSRATKNKGVIDEKNGVPFIKKGNTPLPESNLDGTMKALVDSVLTPV